MNAASPRAPPSAPTADERAPERPPPRTTAPTAASAACAAATYVCLISAFVLPATSWLGAGALAEICEETHKPSHLRSTCAAACRACARRRHHPVQACNAPRARARRRCPRRRRAAPPSARARTARQSAASAAARQPGRGRCVSIFLVKHTRCIGRSQSTRPAKKDATAAAPRSARRPQRAAQPARSASTAATVCADALGCARQPLSRCMPKPNEALQTAWGGAVEGDDR
jgi:hypothetical protein